MKIKKDARKDYNEACAGFTDECKAPFVCRNRKCV